MRRCFITILCQCVILLKIHHQPHFYCEIFTFIKRIDYICIIIFIKDLSFGFNKDGLKAQCSS